jgi:hypothetical protein
MAKPHLAVIVGSNRRESINRKLAHALTKLGEDVFDASFVRIDDLPTRTTRGICRPRSYALRTNSLVPTASYLSRQNMIDPFRRC